MDALAIKTVSLTFRGFDEDAETVIALMGVGTDDVGNKGDFVRPGGRTRLTRSYVIYEMCFSVQIDLCEMIPALLLRLGGVEHILRVKQIIKPEFLEFNFNLPVAKVEFAQDGYLSEQTIAEIHKLGASAGFNFI